MHRLFGLCPYLAEERKSEAEEWAVSEGAYCDWMVATPDENEPASVTFIS